MRVVWIAAFAFGLAPAAAIAQGTPEQREACTPDALRLCTDTIPDIGRTTACMKSHVADLSPRCRAAMTTAARAPATKTPSAETPSETTPTPRSHAAARAPRRHDVDVRYPAWTRRAAADPDAEVPYVPPRRVIEPPALSEPGPVVFPRHPLPDGSFCSPPYDFCEPPPDEWW